MEYELPRWCKRCLWTLHHHRGDTTTTRTEQGCTVHNLLGIPQTAAPRPTLNWCPGLRRGAPVAGRLFKEASITGTSIASQMIRLAPLFSQPIACPTSQPQPPSGTSSSPSRHSTCSCLTWTRSTPTCPSPTVHLPGRTASIHPRCPSPRPLQDPHTKQTLPSTVTITPGPSTTPFISPCGRLGESQHCPIRVLLWSPRCILHRGPTPATNTKTPPRHTPQSPTSTHAKQPTTTPTTPPPITTSRCQGSLWTRTQAVEFPTPRICRVRLPIKATVPLPLLSLHSPHSPRIHLLPLWLENKMQRRKRLIWKDWWLTVSLVRLGVIVWSN